MRKGQTSPNDTITPEILNLPEWDLGPEDAMQIHYDTYPRKQVPRSCDLH